MIWKHNYINAASCYRDKLCCEIFFLIIISCSSRRCKGSYSVCGACRRILAYNAPIVGQLLAGAVLRCSLHLALIAAFRPTATLSPHRPFNYTPSDTLLA